MFDGNGLKGMSRNYNSLVVLTLFQIYYKAEKKKKAKELSIYRRGLKKVCFENVSNWSLQQE